MRWHYVDFGLEGYSDEQEQQEQQRRQQLIVALATLNALRFMAALARCDDATTGRIASSSFQDTATGHRYAHTHRGTVHGQWRRREMSNSRLAVNFRVPLSSALLAVGSWLLAWSAFSAFSAFSPSEFGQLCFQQ